MELDGDIARKTGDGSLLAIEAEKSRRAAEIGARSGLFRVPEVRGLDEAKGILEFERIQALSKLLHFAASHPDETLELLARAGRATARIHAELQLDEAMRIPLPAPWAERDDQEMVFFHGDLSANNICIDTASRELVFVDWAAAPMIGGEATVGPRAYDVVCLVRHLMLGAPSRRTLRWSGRDFADRFVSSYVAEAGGPIAAESWDHFFRLLDEGAETQIKTRIAQAGRWRRPTKALLQNTLLRRWRNYAPPAGSLA